MSERCPMCGNDKWDDSHMAGTRVCTHPWHSGAASVPAPTTQALRDIAACSSDEMAVNVAVKALGAPTTQPEVPAPAEQFPSRSQEKRVRTLRGDKNPLDPKPPELQERVAALEPRTLAKSGDTVCQVCGLPNPCWFIESRYWNVVVPERAGVLCMRCFTEQALSMGITGCWKLMPDSDTNSLILGYTPAQKAELAQAPKIKDDPICGPVRAEIANEYIAAGKPKPEMNWLYGKLIQARMVLAEAERVLENRK